MDPAVQVAVVSLVGVIATAAGSVVVAKITNTRETKRSAETALERTLRERLLLKDEQLRDRDERIEDLEAENEKLRLENRALRRQLDVRLGSETG